MSLTDFAASWMRSDTDALLARQMVHVEIDKHGEWTATRIPHEPGIDPVGRGESAEAARADLEELAAEALAAYRQHKEGK